MSQTLTDSDSFDAPAPIAVNGEPNTIESILSEFQILQNRSTYNKNRRTEDKAEFDALKGQLTGARVIIESSQLSHASGLYAGQGANSLIDVPYATNTFVTTAAVGDVIRVYAGAFKLSHSSTGTGKVRLAIIENAGGTPTETDVDYTIAAGGEVPLTIVYQLTVAHAGELGFKLQVSGDGTDVFYLRSYSDSWGFAELLRVIT